MTTRPANSPVSLFPFLAVLVCAMGALIFLLLIATRRIRAEVRAETVDEARRIVKVVEPREVVSTPQPKPKPDPAPPSPRQPPVVDETPPPPPQLPHVDWDHLLADFQQRRKQRQAGMDEQARSLALVVTGQQRADRGLRQLWDEKEILERHRVDLETSLAPLQERAKTLREELNDLELEIRQSRRRRAAVETRFAFLPFDGVSGTHRRPIFIECHPDRIEFASEKIGLTAAELNGFTIDDNPLLAGTRALIAYWEKWDAMINSNQQGRQMQNQSEKTGKLETRKPYVLIVVRPRGVHAYYIARKLLARLKTPIGYELVSDDMPLAWPGLDTRAATVCHEAIDRVLARRPLTSDRFAGAGDVPGGRGKGTRMGPRRQRLVGENDVGGIGSERTAARRAVSRRSTGTAEEESTAGRAEQSERTPSVDSRAAAPGRPAGDGKQKLERATFGDRRPAESHSPTAEEPNGEESKDPGRTVDTMTTFDTLTIGRQSRRRLPGQPSRGLSSRGSPGNPGQAGEGSPRYWGVAGLRATIGYERRVRVRVSPDRLVVGDERPIEAGVDVRADVVRRKVVAALQQIAQDWGPPPERFYWVPAVRFEVSPGGHLHYERLDSVFRRWKLPTTVEFILETFPASPSRLLQQPLEIPTP